ncbi:MAG TPA: SRPBCC family protein [Mucilaginibacter sp.]
MITLTTSIKFKAPVAEVWKGLTDPEIVRQYFFGTNLSSDWKVGGPITFSGEWDGHKYEDGGVILDIDPPKYLTYTYWSSMSGTENRPENYQNITYSLSEAYGETILTLTQDNVKSEQAREHSEQNWQSVFDGLKKILEK